MRRAAMLAGLCTLLAYQPATATAQASKPDQTIGEVRLFDEAKPDLAMQPWLDPKRNPDERATLAMAQMTLAEKIQLLHGAGFLQVPPASNGGAGFVPGIKRLGIPDLNLADSTVGVARGANRSRYSTLMPSTIAEAASWDPQTAYSYAALIARELRAQGYNISLAGGVNLAREPRNGRTFEYRGEDPLLVGTMAAQAVRGMQDGHVVGDVKHYALNDQETGRHVADVHIDYRAARESDLLAFEIAVRDSQPGMVMCAYNRVWGNFACENELLLNRILKQEWGFKGWVVSDWGATHSTEKAILSGLDQEQPDGKFFGAPLEKAVADSGVPRAAIDASAHRILRTMFAVGVIDNPPKRMVVDVASGLAAAQHVEEQSAVLLKNDAGVLPIAGSMRTVAVIGGHADIGVLTGGGSGQVDPPGGNALAGAPSETRISPDGKIVFPKIWWPSSPLAALRAAAPDTRFVYDDGSDPKRAARLAAGADMALLFAYAPSGEEYDNNDMTLPDRQDDLIDTISTANPKTVVVLETTGAVTMSWIDKVKGVVAAWFPGAAGGEAIANLLLGRVNFSGKLPITFPRSEADLAHPKVQGADAPMVAMTDSIVPGLKLKTKAPFDITYNEGVLVGYKWFEAKGLKPLFAFGHGLSYTSFDYSGLKVSGDGATFSVTNTGSRQGAEVSQVYVALPDGVRLAPKQLAGWSKISLRPGEKRSVTVKFEPLAISAFDVKRNRWQRPAGTYRVFVGGASDSIALTGEFKRR